MNIFSIRIKLATANLYYGLALAAVFCIALFIRTYFPYDNVFAGDWVRFQYTDAWYHMRLVENFVHNFPHRICFDPYTYFPHGQHVHFMPFFDLFLGFFVWLFGAGSPSTRVIETVGAYFPAILGALMTIPVYFMGRELFNKKVGLIAAALIAILPGEFLSRSLLGNTDHHIAENLLMILTIFFLILALKSARQKGISFNSLRIRDWAALRKPLLYSLLAGIVLGLYLLTWLISWIFIIFLIIFSFTQYIIDHMKVRANDYLFIILVPALFIALFIIIPQLVQLGMLDPTAPPPRIRLNSDSLFLSTIIICISIGAILIMSLLSVFMSHRNIKRVFYPLSLVALALIPLVLIYYLIAPSNFNEFIDFIYRYVFSKTSTMLTVAESGPLSLVKAWDKFTTVFFLSLIPLVFLAHTVIKKGLAEMTLFLIWSLLMLGAALAQIRLSYYFAVNAALLVAYLSWKSFSLIGIKELAEKGGKERTYGKVRSRSSRKMKGERSRSQITGLRIMLQKRSMTRYALSITAVVAIFFLAFYSNIGKSVELAGGFKPPPDDWHDALVWLKGNTPDPFPEPDFYYQIYERPPGKEDYSYPESAYGIMSWWDYGHWITYIAHRIPVTNPHWLGVEEAATFFTEQEEETANQILDKLGARYIIIDLRTALYKLPETGKSDIKGYFSAIIEWAGKDRSDFFEKYYLVNEQGKLESITLYYPEYYRSMSSRLYFFAGDKVIPANSTCVISHVDKLHSTGIEYKEISFIKRFATYEDAIAFIELHGPSDYRIVGADPLFCPVPLDKLEHYKLVYQSPTIVIREDKPITEVEIFEYIP